MLSAVVVGMRAGSDSLPDYTASQQTARRFRTDDHLRTCAQHGVDKGVDGKGVEAVDRWDVSKIRGKRQGHGDVEGCHGQGSDEVSFDECPAVLSDPIGARDVV